MITANVLLPICLTEHTKTTIKREELYYMIMFHMGKGLPRSCDYILDMISVDCMAI